MKNKAMRSWLTLLMGGFLLVLLSVSGVAAYSFDFITPDEQTATIRQGVGVPIVVECYTDNIPPGATMTFTLTGSSSNSVASQSVVIQSDKYFGVTFDTTNLAGGAYTVTVTPPKAYELGSKRNWFTVQLIDRTSELTNTAQRVQTDPYTLKVSGKASSTGSRGVELTVYKGSQTDGSVIFGPTWIGSDDNGQFSQEVSASGTGMYQVAVKDKDGYIGTLTYTITANSGTSTPTPTATQAATITANAIASMNEPAYFSVRTVSSGETEVSVIRGADWVIDYSLNGAAAVRADSVDENSDEKFTITGNGGTLYLMVYPKDGQAKAYVYVKNAVSITEDSSVSSYFGKPGEDPSATSSPIGALIPVIGIFGAAYLLRRR